MVLLQVFDVFVLVILIDVQFDVVELLFGLVIFMWYLQVCFVVMVVFEQVRCGWIQQVEFVVVVYMGCVMLWWKILYVSCVLLVLQFVDYVMCVCLVWKDCVLIGQVLFLMVGLILFGVVFGFVKWMRFCWVVLLIVVNFLLQMRQLLLLVIDYVVWFMLDIVFGCYVGYQCSRCVVGLLVKLWQLQGFGVSVWFDGFLLNVSEKLKFYGLSCGNFLMLLQQCEWVVVYSMLLVGYIEQVLLWQFFIYIIELLFQLVWNEFLKLFLVFELLKLQLLLQMLLLLEVSEQMDVLVLLLWIMLLIVYGRFVLVVVLRVVMLCLGFVELLVEVNDLVMMILDLLGEMIIEWMLQFLVSMGLKLRIVLVEVFSVVILVWVVLLMFENLLVMYMVVLVVMMF